MNDQVKNTGLDEAIAAVAARESVTEFYFVACGGSNALLMQGQYIMDREAKGIAAYSYSSAEFIARAPVRLGKNSVCHYLFPFRQYARDHRGHPLCPRSWCSDDLLHPQAGIRA